MKSKAHIIFIGCMIILSASLSSSGQEKYFDSAEEAIKQAKTDLMAILEQGNKFDLDIDMKKLQEAEAAANIPYLMINFQSVLNTDSLQKLSELRSERLYYMVPLLTDNQTVAVFQINKMERGWIMGGLMNQNIRSAINHIPVEFRKENIRRMMIYEIPNIHAILYTVETEEGEMVFTDYRGKYSLKQAVELPEVYELLHSDAIEFQRLHGDKVKEGRLVK